MENKCKRFLSLLLAFVMVLGMFPMGHAHAAALSDTKANWKAVAVNSEMNPADGNDGPLTYAWDNNYDTMWHSNYRSGAALVNGAEVYGIIDFGSEQTINWFSFRPRKGADNGQVSKASLYVGTKVSETGDVNADYTWKALAEDQTFDENMLRKIIFFDEQPVRYVKFVVKAAKHNHVCISEFDIGLSPRAYVSDTDAGSNEMWTYDRSVISAFDGDTTTFWTTAVDGSVEDKYLIVDLGEQTWIEQVDYTGRNAANYDATGNLLDYKIWVSNDMVNWGEEPVASGATIKGLNEIKFTPVSARYVKLTATQSYHWQDGNRNKAMTVGEFAVHEHKHSYNMTAHQDATCTVDGYTTYTCSGCNDTYTDVIKADGHSYDVTAHQDATCTVDGYTTYTCSSCNDTYTNVNSAPGHKDADDNFECDVCEAPLCTEHEEETVKGYAATCTEAGKTDGVKCSICGKILTAQEDIEAKGHDYQTSYDAPTCTEAGGTTTTCSRCDYEAFEEEAATGHKNTTTIPGTPATLNAPGKADAVFCNDCQTTISGGEDIPQLTMKNAKVLDGGEVLALADLEYVLGGTEGAYSLCHGGTYYVNLRAKNVNCNQTTTASAYLNLDWDDSDGDAVSIWQHTDRLGYLYIHYANAEPKWDVNGSYAANNCDMYLLYADANSTNADVPGYTIADAEYVAEHIEEGESYLIAAKNTHGNWFVMVPSVTGNAVGDYIAQVVTDAVTHEHKYTTVTTTATCGKDGVKTETCDCGHIHTSADAATGAHAWDDATCTAPETCSVCGATQGSALGHTEEKVPSKAPTCTEPGLTEGKKCSVCGTWIIPQEEIDAKHGNVINVARKDATCTAAGNVEYWYCFDCGKYWLDQDLIQETTKDAVVLPALGHYYEVDGVAPATCTDAGYTVYRCWECDHVIVGSYVDALGHTAGEPVRENEVKPTLNSAGYYDSVVYCSVCKFKMSSTRVDVAPLTGAVAEANGYKYASLIEAVAAGDKVKLLADAYGDGIIIDKDITIDLNGFTYTIDGVLVGSAGTKSCGFQILSGNTVTIKNGSIVMDEKAVRGHDNKVGNNFVIQNYADMTLEDVTVTGNSYTSYVVSNNSGKVVMTGTVINAPEGAVAFDVCKYLSYAEPTVTVNDCVFNGKIEAAAKVDNTYYATFEKALVSGNEINLLVPVTVTKDTAYDLTGKTITSEGDAFIVKSGTLTLDGGVVKAGTTGIGSWCAVWADGGNVVINGGTYSVGGDSSTTDVNHQNDLIYTKNGGTVTINGGTFLYTKGVWTLNQNDKTGGTITVTGGSFQNWNPANNNSEGAGTNFVAEGYCSALENDFYVVAKHEYKDVVTDPTCTEKGYTTHTCERCGDEYVDTYVDAKGHDMQKTADEIPATCEADGKTAVYTCANGCGKSEGGDKIGATGHDMQKSADEISATCEADGKTAVYTCANGCGKSEGGDKIDALGHNWNIVDGVRSCSVCGERFNGKTNGYLYVDGVLYTGIYEAENRFYQDGVLQLAYELVEHNGNIYFIYDAHQIARGCTLYLGEQFVSGETFPDGRAIQPGYYEFLDDGTMVIPEEKDGIDGDYLYINDVKQLRYKLVKHEGNYYFIGDGDKVSKDVTYYLSEYYVIDDIEPGYYYFDSEGRMELWNGVINGYAYDNGQKVTAYQVVKFGDDYYFVSDGHKVATNTTLYMSAAYLEGTDLTAGYYVFDEYGVMTAKEGVYGDYLYINGVKQTAYALVEWDGNYYFVNDGHKVAKNKKIYLSAKFVEGTDFAVGYYNFDAEGKMIIE